MTPSRPPSTPPNPVSADPASEPTASAGSWWLLAGLAALVALPPVACSDPDTPGGVDSPAVAALLADAGPEVVLPALAEFQLAVDALSESLAAWQEALSDGDGAKAQAEAQAQWRSTMAIWQTLEVMQIGPAGSSLTTIGGADLRDEIYSWPTTNPCRIDQETVHASWNDAAYFTDSLVNAYGLDALEHTLFAGLDSACSDEVDIIADGSWADLGESGILSGRAAFSVALADHVRAQAAALIAAWSPEDGDFSGQLALTVDGPYASEQEALNAVYDALFYLESVTKDRKLATPLGLMDCDEALCPEEVEGLESGTGAAAIVANLDGFEALFTGGAGAGFDDLLLDLGHGDLSDQILADLDEARALALAIDAPLDEAVRDQTAEVEALYEAVKVVTDNLKGDLATVLVLSIPSEAAGDND